MSSKTSGVGVNVNSQRSRMRIYSIDYYSWNVFLGVEIITEE